MELLLCTACDEDVAMTDEDDWISPLDIGTEDDDGLSSSEDEDDWISPLDVGTKDDDDGLSTSEDENNGSSPPDGEE
jgi:hypothetical protein